MFEFPAITPSASAATESAVCAHCGDACDALGVVAGGRRFCCNGCRTVYELLERHHLCEYYAVDPAARRVRPTREAPAHRFDFLDDPDVVTRLTDFAEGGIAQTTFTVPGMHCSSCIWLLERLHHLDRGVVNARVHFPRKEVTVTYRPAGIRLRGVVSLLASIGYEPLISLESVAQKQSHASDRRLYYRIGVAGFAFGNVMLFSFPEYLAPGGTLDPAFHALFGWLNVVLSVPVLFYSSSEFFRSAWISLRQRGLNIDVPISLGILTLFIRSAWEIATGTGSGFFDSFTGLVFFMLIGRIFQKKTHDALRFDRDFRSYFPLRVNVIRGNRETSLPLMRLAPGDRILVRNQEIIPADAVLLKGDGAIDYSFVTGEADIIPKRSGDTVYAGGRQSGTAIELEVITDVSHSALVRLWNNDIFTKPASARLPQLVHRISSSFTGAVLAVAVAAAAVWAFTSIAMAASVFTAVLIVACPCAVALASPFALGTALRVLSANGFYVKNAESVEALAHIDTIVFDKTGTLTHASLPEVRYHGRLLDTPLQAAVHSVLLHSTHVLSRQITASLGELPLHRVTFFEEEPGRGVRGVAAGVEIRAGSRAWTCTGDAAWNVPTGRNAVFISIDGEPAGVFTVAQRYRSGLADLLRELRPRYGTLVLSGDTNRDEAALRAFFGDGSDLRFSCSPEEKMRAIAHLQKDGRHVLMIGDGLNDAGALRTAQVGVSVAEDMNTFSPACDAILAADRFGDLGRFLRFSRASMRIVRATFALSLAYNIAGLTVAVAGMLTPLVSAVLMPLSSVTVVACTTLATRYQARREGLR